jgi:hypothetical protein
LITGTSGNESAYEGGENSQPYCDPCYRLGNYVLPIYPKLTPIDKALTLLGAFGLMALAPYMLYVGIQRSDYMLTVGFFGGFVIFSMGLLVALYVGGFFWFLEHLGRETIGLAPSAALPTSYFTPSAVQQQNPCLWLNWSRGFISTLQPMLRPVLPFIWRGGVC